METRPRPARVLVVDDDPMIGSLAARTLRHAGFVVELVEDGEAALAAAQAQPFDLVLLDLVLPDIDGFAVCRHLRSTQPDLPVLMLTGLDDTDSIEQAYRAGATDFITKPIHWTLLTYRVRYALRAAAAADAVRRSQHSLARAQRLAGMGSFSARADGPLECSDQLQLLFGVTPEAPTRLSAAAMLDRVVDADRDRVRRARGLAATEGTAYEIEYTIRRDDGSVRWLFEQGTPRLDAQGGLDGIEGITQDITERVQAQERIRQLAHYDAVTGLPNRQFFGELALPALELARRQQRCCAVMHLDLDRFKSVNDSFGRATGDRVLQLVAERLRGWIRAGDLASAGTSTEGALIARVGSNSFTLLISDLAARSQASLVARRLADAVAQSIEVEGQPLVLSASIGIALFPDDGADLPALGHAAEQALYAAKAAGRGQHRFYDEQLNIEASGRLRLEVELRRAIAGGELRLHLQPKVDAADGRWVGAEALVRWQHPERGLVAPGEFIPMAEETGLIVPLTDWVLDATCERLRAWNEAGLPPLTVAVNLAASSFADPELPGRLDALLQRHGLTADRLVLEVTESVLMRDVERSAAMLHALRARGYGIALDDFGTGYSSLSYLKRFPIDELKIDRSFVGDALRGERDGALVVAIVTLGRQLGMQVVAEGVETAEQRGFLMQHGCNVHQGYLFSRPLPVDQWEALLRVPGTASATITGPHPEPPCTSSASTSKACSSPRSGSPSPSAPASPSSAARRATSPITTG